MCKAYCKTLLAITLGIWLHTYSAFSVKAAENPWLVDPGQAYVEPKQKNQVHDLSKIAEKYEGQTGPQLGLPARLWCGDFINFLRKKQGLKPIASRRAVDQVKGGKRIYKPVAGALVITKRGRNGNHVGIIAEVLSNGKLKTIGGNVSGRVAKRTQLVSNAIYVIPE